MTIVAKNDKNKHSYQKNKKWNELAKIMSLQLAECVTAWSNITGQLSFNYIQGAPKVGIQLLKVGFRSKNRFVVLI